MVINRRGRPFSKKALPTTTRNPRPTVVIRIDDHAQSKTHRGRYPTRETLLEEGSPDDHTRSEDPPWSRNDLADPSLKRPEVK